MTDLVILLLWLIFAFTGLNVLGGIAVCYWCWRCGQRAEHALQDMRISMLSTAEWSAVTADKAVHTEANIKYFIESQERRNGQADELRRQQHLAAVRQFHAASQAQTMPAMPAVGARQPVRTEDLYHA